MRPIMRLLRRRAYPIPSDFNGPANLWQTPEVQFISSFATNMLRVSRSTKRDSRTIRLLATFFDDKHNKEAFLCQSRTFARAKIGNDPVAMASAADRQASAKLHCYFGVPIHSPSRTKFKSSYPYAVSMVYDLRNYTEETMWGPFLPDGKATVDWEKMEAAMIVLGHNLRESNTSTDGIFKAVWTTPWLGASPDSFNPLSLMDLPEPVPPPKPEDPYNIEGTWIRVCGFNLY
jgi:hypothetical protein